MRLENSRFCDYIEQTLRIKENQKRLVLFYLGSRYEMPALSELR